jgi:hypothetical protein
VLVHARLTQYSADPFPDSQFLAPRQEADLVHLGIGQKDLESLTHSMSIV